MTLAKNSQTKIEQIYRDNRDYVYNYIYRLCNDPEQAQDVTQQTFIKILTDRGLESVSNIKSYLFTIARNHLYDTWKKKKETLLDDAGIDIAASADENDLTDELAQKQLQQAVVFCVQRLSDKHRELMILRYMEDLSIKDIALITQYSESNIKVSLLRARQQFDRRLTQHMYLKVAKSRQQCSEMNTMLAPYTEYDIPEDKLGPFEKHIDKCSICAEDAEEQKRNRKLFALIPLAAAPLSLDTSFNDALAESTTASTPMPDANTTSNALLIKVAASVVVAALIVGGILLLPDKDSSISPVEPTQPAQQQNKKPAPAVTPVVQPAEQAAPTGTVPVTATARLTASSPPVEVLWGIYRVNTVDKTKEQHLGGAKGQELNKKLVPGQYTITARVGDAEVERIIEVVSGKPVSLDMVINAGEVNISTNLPEIVRPRHSQLSYLIFKSRQDMENHQPFVGRTFSLPAIKFTLAAGDYFLKASFTGFGDIEAVQSFKVVAGKTIDIEIPVEIGIFKPEAILSNKNLFHIRNNSWSIQNGVAQQNHSPSYRTIRNGKEEPMAPGHYTFNVKLGSIEQQTSAAIKMGQLTSHKVILMGGIVSATAWTDKTKTKINDKVYFDYFKSQTDNTVYNPRLRQTMSKQKAIDVILPVGKFNIIARYSEGRANPVEITRNITVNDGDDTHIDFIIPE